MRVEEIIFGFAEEKGVAAGITTAEPFWEIAEELAEKTGELTGFVCQDMEKRIDPRKTMPEARSIVVLAKSYKKRFDFRPDGEKRGKISMGAIGPDYHIQMKALFAELISRIQQKTGFRYMVFADTGPLSDRSAALRAGLGVLGKNGAVISRLGSMINLGYMLTDLPLTPAKALSEDFCGDCTRCFSACPTGALTEAGYDFKKCISYLTQKKGELSPEEKHWLGTALYGCDICFLACPANKDAPGEPVTDISDARPLLESVLKLTNRGFKEKYGQTAMGWRGAGPIKRNARAALENLEGKE